MANPQPTDAHIRIAHSIQEQIMVSDFSKRQRKILDLILRLSWGCGKKEAIIPQQNKFEIVGIYECDIKTELEYLTQSKVIFINGINYSFNKDYDQWRISRAKQYTPERLSELLSLNLHGLSDLQSKVSETQSKLGDLQSPKDTGLSEMQSKDLVKDKVDTLQNTKFSTSELASPKESIKEIYKENTLLYKEYGEFQNVSLNEDEHGKLIEKLGKDCAEKLIEQLSAYMKQNPANAKKYKDHYATILNWSRRDGNNGNGQHKNDSGISRTEQLRASIGRSL